VRKSNGRYIHHQFFTRLLSDVYGVQARGGCACAGPYAHRLLELSVTQSEKMSAAIERGEELEKPGWVRLNLCAIFTDSKTDSIIEAVDRLALEAANYENQYLADPATARFTPTTTIKELVAK
jgi:selenocysteine lyase/cysteine desulfurase